MFKTITQKRLFPTCYLFLPKKPPSPIFLPTSSPPSVKTTLHSVERSKHAFGLTNWYSVHSQQAHRILLPRHDLPELGLHHRQVLVVGVERLRPRVQLLGHRHHPQVGLAGTGRPGDYEIPSRDQEPLHPNHGPGQRDHHNNICAGADHFLASLDQSLRSLHPGQRGFPGAQADFYDC